ncbi:sulfurtransferase complex subunit TusB [Moritella sp. Urea-trap-13]|uniref:sulfurtransferase complex subunit TusB n=1 Tax=Moritella sp. Urea-trap-13 TaxID=2058327 RepID=UPI000C325610|nr:sulfurtransferase complex subunit TusB [Moritella sp. Urea-trap-13]PKH09091.1 sulfurtransferase complex subunit TusB [Moritella sp. Urea-trap-13]
MLHIIKSSPFSKHTFIDSIAYFNDGDAVIFIQDAVVITASQHKYAKILQDLMPELSVYTLAEDLNARGLSCIVGRQVSYPEFVNLTVAHLQIQTWN